jgi:hypothetical protein
MRVNSDHHAIAEAAFTDGKNTPQVQAILMKGKNALTKAQANSCCKTARKHLGIYKPKKQEIAENAKRAKQDADSQASKTTQVNEDA